MRACAAFWSSATSVIKQVRRGKGHPSPWLVELVRRKPPKLAAVALANKTARIAWKLMVSGERYDHRRASTAMGRNAGKATGLAERALNLAQAAPPAAA